MWTRIEPAPFEKKVFAQQQSVPRLPFNSSFKLDFKNFRYYNV